MTLRRLLFLLGRLMMNDFPEFMKNPANKMATQEQYTKGIEGYVFDGVMAARSPIGQIP